MLKIVQIRVLVDDKEDSAFSPASMLGAITRVMKRDYAADRYGESDPGFVCLVDWDMTPAVNTTEPSDAPF